MAMDISTLNAIVAEEERQALGYVGKLSHQREKALQYYNGEATGELAPPEAEGRSSVVSSDLADTIEWMLPSLLKIFTGGEQIVRFDPRHWQDQQAAKQATDYVNWIFSVRNPGFLILHTMFKDALLSKAGVVKVYWDDSKEEKREEYHNLTDIGLGQLAQDSEIEIKEHTLNPDGTHDVACIRSKDTGHVRIENVPPEEFLISRKAKNISESPFVAHRVRRTLSELRAMGYKNVENLPGDDQYGEWNEERIERLEFDDEYPMENNDTLDPSQKAIWLTEAYMRVDWDGDGVAELRKITRCGSEILDNEEVDAIPFAAITPILMPHRFFGRSIADVISDIQRIKTAVMRQLIDNLYLQNNVRYYVDENKEVNLDDLLTVRPGGIVRGRGEGGVVPLTVPAIEGVAIQAIEYLDSVRENRTGVTKYNQGLDANTLNKTATGINIINNNSQQRLELIARVFAETGVKDLFDLILKLVCQYQKQPQVVRLEGQWVQIDPREWRNQFDMTISVGLGTGDKQQQGAMLSQILQVQQEVGQSPWGQQLLSPQNVYNVLLKLEQNTGIKGLDAFSDPSKAPPQASQQKPDPHMAKVQQEGQLAQAKMQQDAQIKQQEMQVRYNADVLVAQIQAQAQVEIARLNAALKVGLQQEEQIASAVLQGHQTAAANDQAGAQMVQAHQQHLNNLAAQAGSDQLTAQQQMVAQAMQHAHDAQMQQSDQGHEADMQQAQLDAQQQQQQPQQPQGGNQ